MEGLIKKQIAIVLLCQATVILALEVSNPFLPIYIQQLSGINKMSLGTWTAIVYLAPLVSTILMAPVWGKLSQRLGYKNMLIRAILALCIIQLALYFTSDLVLFSIFRFIQGGIAGSIAASQGYLLWITPSNKRSYILGLLQTSIAGGIAVGPIIGGALVHLSDYRSLFLISSISCAILAMAVLLLLKNQKKFPKNQCEITKKQPCKKINYLKSPYFILILLAIALSQTVRFLPQTSFAIYAGQLVNSDPILIGALYAVPAICLLILPPVLGKLFDRLLSAQPVKTNTYVYMYFIVIFATATFALYLHGISTNIYNIIAARLLWGACLSAIIPALFSLIFFTFGNQHYGYFIGYATSSQKLGKLSGVLTGALIFQLSNVSNIFYVGSSIYAALLLAFIGIFIYLKIKVNIKQKNAVSLSMKKFKLDHL